MDGSVDGDWHASRSDKKLLSVRFRTEWYISGTAHPGWGESTLTVDRTTGKKLSLGDLVDTGDDFEAWLNAQNWIQLNGWVGIDGNDVSRYNVEGGATAHTGDFYLTATDLVIITWDTKYDTHLSVPLSDLKLKGGDLWNG